MKKNHTTTSLWKLKCYMLLALAVGGFGNVKAQCAANFAYTVNAAGKDIISK